MEMLNIEKELQGNSYPGRGIIIGRSARRNKGSDRLLYYGKK